MTSDKVGARVVVSGRGLLSDSVVYRGKAETGSILIGLVGKFDWPSSQQDHLLAVDTVGPGPCQVEYHVEDGLAIHLYQSDHLWTGSGVKNKLDLLSSGRGQHFQ